MEINTRILIKAENILASRRYVERYLRVCKEAGICPKCGADLGTGGRCNEACSPSVIPFHIHIQDGEGGIPERVGDQVV